MGVKESIEGRKADFAAYVDPQKKDADVVIEVLPTWEPSDEIGLDNGDKPLRCVSSRRRAASSSTPLTSSTRARRWPGFRTAASSRLLLRASSSPPPARSTSTRTSSSWR